MRHVGVLIAVFPIFLAGQAPAGTTVFEGARLIVGDGQPPIENAAFVVTGARIVQVGRAGEVKAPAGRRARRPDRQDRHAGDRRHAHASQPDARGAHRGPAAPRLLRRQRGDEPRPGRRRPAVPDARARRCLARRDSSPPAAASPCRSRDGPTCRTGSPATAKARKAVQELAAKKVDIVKIWVDDRDGKYKKLTPELYGAIIDEAHKNGLRVTAHIFTLEDAKGLLRAGIDAFAHGVRDRDIDDEVWRCSSSARTWSSCRTCPIAASKTDLSWLRDSLAGRRSCKKLQAARHRSAGGSAAFGIQARNLAKLNAAGVRIALGTDGNIAVGPHTSRWRTWSRRA